MTKNVDRIDLLRKATMYGDFELTKFCIEHTNINFKTTNEFIENAGYNGYYDIVKLLLEHGANPEGYGGLLSITKVRGHYNTNKLLNSYIRRKKLNKILKS